MPPAKGLSRSRTSLNAMETARTLRNRATTVTLVLGANRPKLAYRTASHSVTAPTNGSGTELAFSSTIFDCAALTLTAAPSACALNQRCRSSPGLNPRIWSCTSSSTFAVVGLSTSRLPSRLRAHTGTAEDDGQNGYGDLNGGQHHLELSFVDRWLRPCGPAELHLRYRAQ